VKGVDPVNFNNFQRPSPRPANTFIDPSMLTANGIVGTAQDQYNGKQDYVIREDSSLTNL
jgi:hypothetical protein